MIRRIVSFAALAFVVGCGSGNEDYGHGPPCDPTLHIYGGKLSSGLDTRLGPVCPSQADDEPTTPPPGEGDPATECTTGYIRIWKSGKCSCAGEEQVNNPGLHLGWTIHEGVCG